VCQFEFALLISKMSGLFRESRARFLLDEMWKKVSRIITDLGGHAYSSGHKSGNQWGKWFRNES
jgi:hypothetical protein